MKKIQFGSGKNKFPGWENTNYPEHDITKRLKFQSSSVDFIFHEHVLEHIDEADGFYFLKESYRILKPGGVMRIVCPSIDGAIDIYQNWDNIDPKMKERHGKHFGPFRNANAFINHIIYFEAARYVGKKLDENYDQSIPVKNKALWHVFMYDKASLQEKLEMIGFSKIVFPEKLESEHGDLRNLESRLLGHDCDPQYHPWKLDLVIEATK